MACDLSSSFGGFYREKRVLVTGDTGFKGAWLTQWLHLLGADVKGVGLPPESGQLIFDILLGDWPNHIDLDVRDLRSLTEVFESHSPNIVLHLAAQSLVRKSYQIPAATVTTNVAGTANVLEAARHIAKRQPCNVVIVTSDKCYANDGSGRRFRESDPMGGHDVYSASKGAAELIVSSWRASFAAAHDTNLRIASARAGNVIGGGDRSEDRIMPDAIDSLTSSEPIAVRNPSAVRPWQHVLEPLSGYLALGCAIDETESARSAWNFGPDPASERTVAELCDAVILAWGSGSWIDVSSGDQPTEASVLRLSNEKARSGLGWSPVWDFSTTVDRTVEWYKMAVNGADRDTLFELTRSQIEAYVNDASTEQVAWAKEQSKGRT